MEVKILGVQLLRKRKDGGDPMSVAIERLHSTTIIMNNLWKVSPQQVTQIGMMTMLGHLESGKLILRCANDRRPDVTSWRATRESQLGFSHEETLHDSTAQSVVNEVMPRDRTIRLISAQTNSKLPTTITMSNLWKASLLQATQSGMTTALGLLKSGKLILRHTSDRGDLIKFLGK